METLIIAFIFFIPGTALLFWISKRKFNRRNVAGLEGFSSYEKSLLIRLIELVGKWIAYLMIIFGLFLFLMYKLDKKERKKIEQIQSSQKS